MLKMEIMEILRNADLTMNQQADMLAEMVRKRGEFALDYASKNARRQLEIHKQLFEAEREMIVDSAYARGFDDGFESAKGCWGNYRYDDDTGFVK